MPKCDTTTQNRQHHYNSRTYTRTGTTNDRSCLARLQQVHQDCYCCDGSFNLKSPIRAFALCVSRAGSAASDGPGAVAADPASEELGVLEAATASGAPITAARRITTSARARAIGCSRACAGVSWAPARRGRGDSQCEGLAGFSHIDRRTRRVEIGRAHV